MLEAKVCHANREAERGDFINAAQISYCHCVASQHDDAFMLWCACDDVVFLGLGKRNYTPGGNQARESHKEERRERGGRK